MIFIFQSFELEKTSALFMLRICELEGQRLFWTLYPQNAASIHCSFGYFKWYCWSKLLSYLT
jgi:hypothetical protein